MLAICFSTVYLKLMSSTLKILKEEMWYWDILKYDFDLDFNTLCEKEIDHFGQFLIFPFMFFITFLKGSIGLLIRVRVMVIRKIIFWSSKRIVSISPSQQFIWLLNQSQYNNSGLFQVEMISTHLQIVVDLYLYILWAISTFARIFSTLFFYIYDNMSAADLLYIGKRLK